MEDVAAFVRKSCKSKLKYMTKKEITKQYGKKEKKEQNMNENEIK